MELQKEMMKRTDLKQLGCYLLGDAENNAPDETIEQGRKRTRDDLRRTLERAVPKNLAEEVWHAIHEYDATNTDTFFYLGLKTGARLLCTLLDDSEVIL